MYICGYIVDVFKTHAVQCQEVQIGMIGVYTWGGGYGGIPPGKNLNFYVI